MYKTFADQMKIFLKSKLAAGVWKKMRLAFGVSLQVSSSFQYERFANSPSRRMEYAKLNRSASVQGLERQEVPCNDLRVLPRSSSY